MTTSPPDTQPRQNRKIKLFWIVLIAPVIIILLLAMASEDSRRGAARGIFAQFG